MGVLRALVGGQWVDVGNSAGEVYIGTDDPSLLYPSTELWFDTDDNTSGLPWNSPWGIVGKVVKVGDTAGLGPAAVDIPAMSVTGPTQPNRQLKISASVSCGCTATTWVQMMILDAANVQYGIAANLLMNGANGVSTTVSNFFNTTVQTSVTFKLRGQCGAGTFTSQSGSVLIIEDIGPV